jgi:hypothetical protein
MKPEKIDLLQENNRYLTDDEIHPPKPKHRCEYKAPSRVWMNGLFTSRGEKGRDDVRPRLRFPSRTASAPKNLFR